MTTLLCWNVACRVRRHDEQVARVLEHSPDIVCLQELSATTTAGWISRLAERGWGHVALGDSAGAVAHRPLSALTATRVPLAPIGIPGLPWPERVVAARIGGVEVVNVHSPISTSPDLVKVRTHEAVHAHLASGSGPRILCGDLNTPRREHPDGRVWTFARTQRGVLRPERGERWDHAELALIKGLEPHGFRDAFRERHGLEVRELSWKWARWEGGYRLDHLIVSRELDVLEVSYLHAWRDEGLSDHSPLFAEVRFAGAGTTRR